MTWRESFGVLREPNFGWFFASRAVNIAGSLMAPVALSFAVLGIPPILTNTYVGMSQVDRNAVEAARGMGMTPLQSILRIELPLAVPTIMAGVRTAAVNIIATVALASLAGLSTLGDYILGRNVYGDAGVVAGAILIAVLTLALEFTLAGVQWLLTPRGLKVARASGSAA